MKSILGIPRTTGGKIFTAGFPLLIAASGTVAAHGGVHGGYGGGMMGGYTGTSGW